MFGPSPIDGDYMYCDSKSLSEKTFHEAEKICDELGARLVGF